MRPEMENVWHPQLHAPEAPHGVHFTHAALTPARLVVNRPFFQFPQEGAHPSG